MGILDAPVNLSKLASKFQAVKPSGLYTNTVVSSATIANLTSAPTLTSYTNFLPSSGFSAAMSTISTVNGSNVVSYTNVAGTSALQVGAPFIEVQTSALKPIAIPINAIITAFDLTAKTITLSRPCFSTQASLAIVIGSTKISVIGGFMYRYSANLSCAISSVTSAAPAYNLGPWAVEFETDVANFNTSVFGVMIQINTNGAGTKPYRIAIDDVYQTSAEVQTAQTGTNYITIQFTNSGIHKVRIELQQGMLLTALYGLTGSSLIAPKPDQNIRVCMYADSFFAGGGNGQFGPNNMGFWLPMALGWTPDDCSVGGTGYINTGGVNYNFADPVRISDTNTNRIYDAIIIQGSVNDSGQSATAITANALAVFQGIRANQPKATFFIFGCAATIITNLNSAQAVENAVLAAFTAWGDKNAYFFRDSTDVNGSWITTNNQSTYILASDGTHPIPGIGQTYFVNRMQNLILDILKSGNITPPVDTSIILSPINNALVSKYGFYSNPNYRSFSGSGNTIFNNTPITTAGTIGNVMFSVNGVQPVVIYLMRLVSGNTYQPISSVTVTPNIGTNIVNVNLPCLAGDFVGIYYGSNNTYFGNGNIPGQQFLILSGVPASAGSAFGTTANSSIALYFEVLDKQTPVKQADKINLSITPTTYLTIGRTDLHAGTATVNNSYVTSNFLQAGVLKSISVWCTVAGAATVFVCRGASTYIWMQYSINFIAVVGLNVIPINDLPVVEFDRVGFFSATGAAQVGFGSVASTAATYYTLPTRLPIVVPQQMNTNTSAIIAISAQIAVNPVVNPNLTGKPDIYSEVFGPTLNSQWTNTTNWSSTTAGLTSTSAGLANAMILNNQYNILNRTTRVVMNMTTTFKGGIVFKQKETGTQQEGTIAVVDAANSLLIIYNLWDSTSSLPTVYKSIAIPTVIAGRQYYLEIEKSYYLNKVRWIDTITGVVTEVDAINIANDTLGGATQAQVYTGGRQSDTVGLVHLSGTTATFISIEMFMNSLYPLLYIVGDSITEGYGVNDGLQYGQLLAKQIGYNNVVISARGGSAIPAVIEKMSTEVSVLNPRYVMVTIGSNGGNSQVLIAQLIDLIYFYGAKPIINCIPCMSTGQAGTNTGDILTAAGNFPMCRFDIATATNNDITSTQNAALFTSDLLHPNDAGHAAMFARMKIDVPFLFAQNNTNNLGYSVPITSTYAIANHYNDVGSASTTETTLYTDTLPGGIFHYNGDVIKALYSGIFVNSASTKQLRAYFNGSLIFDSTALTISAASSWQLEVEIIRDTLTTARITVSFTAIGTSTNTAAKYTALSSLVYDTPFVLNITGTAAGGTAANNDVVASTGLLQFKSQLG